MGMTRGKSGSGPAGSCGSSGVETSEPRPLGLLELPTLPMGPKAAAAPRRPRARMLLPIIIFCFPLLLAERRPIKQCTTMGERREERRESREEGSERAEETESIATATSVDGDGMTKERKQVQSEAS